MKTSGDGIIKLQQRPEFKPVKVFSGCSSLSSILHILFEWLSDPHMVDNTAQTIEKKTNIIKINKCKKNPT